MTRRLCMLVLLSLAGCAAGRFADRGILWHDPDDRPAPLPRKAEPDYNWIAIRDVAILPVDRTLTLDYVREATNVNALDETPDSSWWVDRHRVPNAPPRVLSDDEMTRGAFGERPMPQPPLTVVKSKDAGANIGFIVKDALGRQFAIKVDPPGLIGMDTSTEVVVSRLAWAAGWFVPAEALLDLSPSDLQLSPTATTIDKTGQKIPLDSVRFRKILAHAPFQSDGTIRVLASLWIEGTILGPYAYYGRRSDDKNDRIDHQNRRDLRGYGVFCPWVNNIDTTDINTLDSYLGKPGQGHVVHWQQDVGGSFGARAANPIDYWMGFDTYLSLTRMLESFFSLGTWLRAWSSDEVRTRRAREIATFPELGFFDAEHFDPRRWHPIFDNPAFERATRRDHYWGAKRILQIGPSELRAAIAVGRYRKAAADRLFDVLWQRRQIVARAYLRDTAPLDNFTLTGRRLCWDDLWIDAGLDNPGSAVYRVGAHEQRERCTDVGDGYQILTLRVHRVRDKGFGPSVRVHLFDRRLIGIER